MEQFFFDKPKASFDAAFASIDISEWLEDETIQTVGFSAVDSQGVDATAEVLEVGQSSFSGSFVFPYIKGGVDGEQYHVLNQVQTLEGSFGEFQITFNVRDLP